MATASKKTLNGFIQQSSNPDFFKKVWKAGGLNFSEVKKYANTGTVPGLIYYSDTEKFVKKHLETILEIVANYDSEAGSNNLVRAHESGNMFNFFARFVWELMMNEMISYLRRLIKR